MARTGYPSPTIALSKRDARRFLLAHHRLWPPRQMRGKDGILDFVRHIGCIQFDPINVVGRNPDLVLQSRVADYCPHHLDELLYEDRLLLDGYDKVASIYATSDWPFFERHRALKQEQRRPILAESLQIAPVVKEAIREQGPLSSIDMKHDEKVDWSWGPTSPVRASLETLYAIGELGIHHRVGTRRYFDLIERLLPAELLVAPDPNETDEAYENWHVLRRVGGLGLASPRSGEHWLGILGVKSRERQRILTRLVERGDLVAVSVEGIPHTLFVRTADLPTLESAQSTAPPEPRAALIGALDNLSWDRDLLRWVFDFNYVWEVYKPAAKRQYGYYVLPVICGDRFVARLDPAFDKKTRELTIANWWWEEGIQLDDAIEAALADCLRDFARYLDASSVQLGEMTAEDGTLQWIRDL